jgi:hypothetical protein
VASALRRRTSGRTVVYVSAVTTMLADLKVLAKVRRMRRNAARDRLGGILHEYEHAA